MTLPEPLLTPPTLLVLDVDPLALAVVLSLLAPNHPLVAAARAGLDVAELRHDRRAAMCQAGKDIAAGADWARVAANHIPYAELERRRAQPGPLAGGNAA